MKPIRIVSNLVSFQEFRIHPNKTKLETIRHLFFLACCISINPYDAAVIGAITSVAVCVVMEMVVKLKIDDPSEAISIHGVGAIFGMIASGLFTQV